MYDAYYGFKEPPFRLSPDPSFFFGSKGHNRALAYLRYGLTQQEGFIVVTGTPGTGKTTIARALLQEVGNERIVVSELNTTHLQADDVLRMVAASYGLEHEDATKATLLKRLENFFLAKYRAGYHCLLMIDESQNLPFESLEELRMLSNFYQGNQALVQIFLLGQEQFRDMLYLPKFEQLRQRVVAATHLEPLSARDTRDYIMHRLTKVGWTGENPDFSKRAYAHIYALTKGIPRRINTFCDRLLLFASLEELQQIDENAVQDVAKELSYEGAGRPGTDKESNDVKISDSEADSMFEDDQEQDSAPAAAEQKTDEDKKSEKKTVEASAPPEEAPKAKETPKPKVDEPSAQPPTPQPEKPKPNLKLVSNSGNTAREMSEPVIVEHVPYVEPDSDMVVEDWVAMLEEVVNYFKAHDKREIERLLKQDAPDEVEQLFEYANGQLKLPANIGSQSAILAGLPFEDIRQAIIFYIKEVLLNHSADYYRRLGLNPGASDTQITTHYKHLFRLFQPDKGGDAGAWDKRSTQRINQAYAILRDAGKRRAYDNFLDDLIDQANRDLSQQSAFVDDDVIEDELVPLPREKMKDVPSMPQEEKKKRGGVWLLLLLVIAVAAAAYVVLQNPALLDQLRNVANDDPVVGQTAPMPIDRSEPVVQEPAVVAVEKAKPVEEIPAVTRPEPVATTPVKPPVVVKETAIPAPKPKPVVQPTPKVVVAPKPTPTPKPVVKPKPVRAVEKPPVVATPKPAAVEKPTPVKPVELTQAEIRDFLRVFSTYYEEGNIEKFITMFSDNAITNDTSGIDGIRKDYEDLFGTTDMRVIEITNLKWIIRDLEARAKGDFVVTIKQKGSQQRRRVSGTMNLALSKVNGTIFLDEMLHSYGTNE